MIFMTTRFSAFLFILFIAGCGRYSARDNDLYKSMLVSREEILPGLSDDEIPEEITLVWLQQILEENNPELEKLRSDVRRYEGERVQSGLYPNPSISVIQNNLSPEDRSLLSEQTEARISQPVVINNRLAIAREKNRKLTEAALFAFEARRQTLHRELRDRYHDILFHKEHERVFWDMLDLVDQLVLDARTENDAKRLQIIQQELNLELTVIAAELSFAEQDLHVLLGTTGTLSSFDFVEELNTGLNYSHQRQLREDLLEETPEYLESLARLESGIASHDLERKTVIPDIDLIFGGGYRYVYDEPYYTAGFRIPIPIFDRHQGKIEASRAIIDGLESGVRKTMLTQHTELKNLLQFSNEIDTTHVVYRDEILPRSRSSFEQVRQEYLKSQSTIHDLLESLQTLLKNERLLLKYRLQVNHANSHAKRFLGLPETIVEIPESRFFSEDKQPQKDQSP